MADSRIPGKKNTVQIQTRYFFLVLWCLVGGLLGAKLLFWITEWKEVAADPGFYFKDNDRRICCLWRNYRRNYRRLAVQQDNKTDFLKYFDLMIPSVALAQGFGRIGCLLAGCCYGKETSGWPSITFHDSDFAPNGVALVPTQIYSSVLDFVHFAILLWIARNKKADGQVAACYMIFYSAGRFILEFFRGDLIRGSVGALSTSQFISIFIMAAGLAMLWFTTVKAGRK